MDVAGVALATVISQTVSAILVLRCLMRESGGIRWNPDKVSGASSWGYGEPPQTLEDFYKRFEGLVNALRDHKDIFGYCYTQLTDVFIEENGIYYFDRSAKFDMEKIRAIQSRAAAYEEQ